MKILFCIMIWLAFVLVNSAIRKHYPIFWDENLAFVYVGMLAWFLANFVYEI